MASVDEVAVRRCTVKIPDGPRTSFQTELVLQHFSLLFRKRTGEVCKIYLEDLIGISVQANYPPTSSDQQQTCRLVVNECPPLKILKDGKIRRSVKSVSIDFYAKETFEANRCVALEWKETLLSECNRAVNETFETADGESSRCRRLLVLINPVAGKGRGESVFIKQVQPMFELAEIEFTVIVTEHQGHARQIVKERDLSGIDGIVVASGDGLIFEIVNGLMERDDWQMAIKTPIAQLPTGSSNTLATSTLHYANEEVDVTNAALAIIRGGTIVSDIASVQTVSGEQVYMTQAVGWGFVSDIDIGSEWLRSTFGGARFLVGSMKHIVQRKVYHGRLHYLPCNQEEEEENEKKEEEEEVEKKEKGKEEEEEEEQEGDKGREERSGEHHSEVMSTENNEMQKPKLHLLPSISIPVPSNWKTIEGNFISFTAALGPFVGQGDLSPPYGSGYIYLAYFLDDLTRAGILQMMFNYEQASYLEREDVHVIKTQAYRLEPLSPPGYLTIDGEVIEYGPHQIQVHSKMIRFMTRMRKN